jgi:hypothetical protein
MTGPMPRGTWTGHIKSDSWDMLHPGREYQVTQAFRDYDHFEHPVGERWTFLGSNFLPYDDGLSLFVSLDGEQEWHIRMQLRPEEQSPVVNALSEYLAEIPPAVASIPTKPVMASAVPLRESKPPLVLFGAAALALVLGFVLLHAGGSGPRLVAPTESSLVDGLAGFALVLGGLLLGFVGVITTFARSRRTKRPNDSSSTR